jgi:hypothetical protein
MFVHSRWPKTDIKSGIFKETIELRFQEWSRGRGISKNAVGDIWDIRHVLPTSTPKVPTPRIGAKNLESRALASCGYNDMLFHFPV